MNMIRIPAERIVPENDSINRKREDLYKKSEVNPVKDKGIFEKISVINMEL
jgi:hypothetical protein